MNDRYCPLSVFQVNLSYQNALTPQNPLCTASVLVKSNKASLFFTLKRALPILNSPHDDEPSHI